MFLSFSSNTTSVTSGVGTAYPSGAPDICGVRDTEMLVSL
jgi:hypothetical protein